MQSEEAQEVKQDYLESLQELTFNSKPIITNLTVIAQENVAFAQVIAQAIEEHIIKVCTNLYYCYDLKVF